MFRICSEDLGNSRRARGAATRPRGGGRESFVGSEPFVAAGVNPARAGQMRSPTMPILEDDFSHSAGCSTDDAALIMRRLGRALAPALDDVVEQSLPPPMLQMLSLLERVERQRRDREGGDEAA